MTEEQLRQIENYKEQMRIRNVRDSGSSLLCGIIFRLLDDGAGVHWLLDEVNDVVEIWQDHHEESEE